MCGRLRHPPNDLPVNDLDRREMFTDRSLPAPRPCICLSFFKEDSLCDVSEHSRTSAGDDLVYLNPAICSIAVKSSAARKFSDVLGPVWLVHIIPCVSFGCYSGSGLEHVEPFVASAISDPPTQTRSRGMH